MCTCMCACVHKCALLHVWSLGWVLSVCVGSENETQVIGLDTCWASALPLSCDPRDQILDIVPGRGKEASELNSKDFTLDSDDPITSCISHLSMTQTLPVALFFSGSADTLGSCIQCLLVPTCPRILHPLLFLSSCGRHGIRKEGERGQSRRWRVGLQVLIVVETSTPLPFFSRQDHRHSALPPVPASSREGPFALESQSLRAGLI